VLRGSFLADVTSGFGQSTFISWELWVGGCIGLGPSFHTLTAGCACKPSPFWSILSHLLFVFADHHLFGPYFHTLSTSCGCRPSPFWSILPYPVYELCVQTITFLLLSLLSICMCRPSPLWSILSRLSVCMCRPSPFWYFHSYLFVCANHHPFGPYYHAYLFVCADHHLYAPYYHTLSTSCGCRSSYLWSTLSLLSIIIYMHKPFPS